MRETPRATVHNPSTLFKPGKKKSESIVRFIYPRMPPNPATNCYYTAYSSIHTCTQHSRPTTHDFSLIPISIFLLSRNCITSHQSKRDWLLTSTTEGIVVSVIFASPNTPALSPDQAAQPAHCNAVPSLTGTSFCNAVAVQQASFVPFASLCDICTVGLLVFFRFFPRKCCFLPSHQAPPTILSSFAGKAAGGGGTMWGVRVRSGVNGTNGWCRGSFLGC